MSPGSSSPRLYRTRVVHARSGKHRYRFRHRAFRLLLDIDRLEDSARGVRGFAVQRWAPVSVYRRDFGPRDGSALRPWVERVLRGACVEEAPRRIRLLCYPRLWGYEFNPLALWFCESARGRLLAVVCEVHNTFGEAYSYVLRPDGTGDGPLHAERDKAFHVSPFIPMAARYRFAIALDEAGLRVTVHERTDDGRTRLVASERGTGSPLGTAALWRAVAAMPLMTLRIAFYIRWHALTLWLRGAPWHSKPPAPRREAG